MSDYNLESTFYGSNKDVIYTATGEVSIEDSLLRGEISTTSQSSNLEDAIVFGFTTVEQETRKLYLLTESERNDAYRLFIVNKESDEITGTYTGVWHYIEKNTFGNISANHQRSKQFDFNSFYTSLSENVEKEAYEVSSLVLSEPSTEIEKQPIQIRKHVLT